MSDYCLILVLEVVFVVIESNKTINDLKILEFVFLYTAYVGDTTIFLNNQTILLEGSVDFIQFFNVKTENLKILEIRFLYQM